MMWKTYKFVPDRGNSKYHYYGLRIKAGSSLLRLMEDQQHLAMRQQPFSQKQRCAHIHRPSPPLTHLTADETDLPFHFTLLFKAYMQIGVFNLPYQMCFTPTPGRLKPVHKVEGLTNGTAAGAGQQQNQQQGSGQVDISTQVQQYQQFLGV